MLPIRTPELAPVPAVVQPPLVCTPTMVPAGDSQIAEPEFPPRVSMSL
jgi:hypothetical protein